ncbi:SO_0444 family Cu/Zn efflux transporter [Alteromonas halophila]|uniref:Permease n=1 Tax=Alteromonas halophila TaxID=516698 RepID=A0A918MXZ0_9ALTE|nr:SO_0444 family Cu/Zn efflux transporter [Alteromonas halophila]GGW83124.1 hypothetical protein GCM10007391_15530 [Alteromonas halophila]
MNDIVLLLENFLGLFIESAPWLLLGLLIAGIMHELVPVSLLQRHMGNASLSAIVKSAVIGAPLPLCSCGVIPAAVGLRRSGASKPATVSFLVSTPETGVDSVSVSYALLGPLFAIVRPIAAIISAIYAGILVRLFAREASQSPRNTVATACCSHKTAPKPEPETVSSCCDSKATSSSCDTQAGTQKAVSAQRSKLRNVLAYASGNLLDDIIIWLLIGLALAAVIQTWVPTDFLTRWGDGLVAMLVMAVIGIPMYICATASTPLAVGFLAAGLSPGAVLVFLMAGPATNISTMGMIMQEMGKRTLSLYLFAVVSASIVAGYGLNALVTGWDLSTYISGAAQAHQHGGGIMQAIYSTSAVVLGALIIRNVWRLIAEKLSPVNTHSDCCH